MKTTVGFRCFTLKKHKSEKALAFDSRLKTITKLLQEGNTQAEIAEIVGMTPNAVGLFIRCYRLKSPPKKGSASASRDSFPS